jgi:hypothetical protein
MKNKFTLIALSGIILLASSCASIVSKSSYPISINSGPSEARLVITDKKGIDIFEGQTPATIVLDASAGFFSKASYQATFEKEGYQTKTVPIEFKLDGWYIGNIVFGGLIGWLIVDPATGAMYKLKTEFLNETLVKNSTSSVDKELKVYALNEIPEGWKENLELISE